MALVSKISSLQELAKLLPSVRADKTVVLCHGVFDPLHIGHMRHFQQAKQMGDILIVTVTPDRYAHQGSQRPIFGQEMRLEAIETLAMVDYVALNEGPTAVETIHLLQPDIYIKGAEYNEPDQNRHGHIGQEEIAVQAIGGRLAFTDEMTFSASNLVSRHLAVFPPEVSAYLINFAARYPAADLLPYLERAAQLKVLVIGETIIDEYQYCETIGKSGKEPILAARYVRSENFAGGILAVANHVAAFCNQVSLLTLLGRQDSQEEFIRAKLNPTIEPIFLYMEESPTIVKRRFVELYPFQKLFELYVMENGDEVQNATQSQALCARLAEILPEYDLVIVTDYGHGMLEPEVIEVLSRQARFLAVNTQVNAGNHGFNTISKYPRADYISVSEKELRLDTRSRHGNLKEMVQEIAHNLACERIMITRGQRGCLCYSRQEGFLEVPALSIRVVDRVGAGDAVFAIASLCAVQNAPMEVVGFVGSAAGGQAVGMVGNQHAVERSALFSQIISLLKLD